MSTEVPPFPPPSVTIEGGFWQRLPVPRPGQRYPLSMEGDERRDPRRAEKPLGGKLPDRRRVTRGDLRRDGLPGQRPGQVAGGGRVRARRQTRGQRGAARVGRRGGRPHRAGAAAGRLREHLLHRQGPGRTVEEPAGSARAVLRGPPDRSRGRPVPRHGQPEDPGCRVPPGRPHRLAVRRRGAEDARATAATRRSSWPWSSSTGSPGSSGTCGWRGTSSTSADGAQLLRAGGRRARGSRRSSGIKSLDYYQAHQPGPGAEDAVGHAVRAMYLYTAMADLAAGDGRPAPGGGLRPALGERHRAQDVRHRRHRLLGAPGVLRRGFRPAQRHGLRGDLRGHRAVPLLLPHGAARTTRRSTPMSWSGRCTTASSAASRSTVESYFYVNPLEVVPAVCDANGSYRHVKYRRQPWYGCACCPPNIARTLSSLGEHACHVGPGARCSSTSTRRGRSPSPPPGDEVVRPGDDALSVERDGSLEFLDGSEPNHHARASNPRLVPRPFGHDQRRAGGSARRTRTATAAWPADGRAETWLELELPMPVERVRADPRVRADYGKVAVQRGPLVYCLEEADNGPGLSAVRLPRMRRGSRGTPRPSRRAGGRPGERDPRVGRGRSRPRRCPVHAETASPTGIRRRKSSCSFPISPGQTGRPAR